MTEVIVEFCVGCHKYVGGCNTAHKIQNRDIYSKSNLICISHRVRDKTIKCDQHTCIFNFNVPVK